MKGNHHLIDNIAFILLLIGGLDLGIMGLFGFDFIAAVFGMMAGITRIAYVLIGISAVYKIICWYRAKTAR